MPRWNSTVHPGFPFGAINLQTGSLYGRVIRRPTGELRVAADIAHCYRTVRTGEALIAAPYPINPYADRAAYIELVTTLREGYIAAHGPITGMRNL